MPRVLSWLQILGWLTAIPALLGFFGAAGWFLDLCANFRWQYAVILTLSLLASAARWISRTAQAPALASVLALALIFGAWLANGYAWLTANGPSAAAALRADHASLKVLIVNVYVGNADTAPLLALIARESPDVVVVLELSSSLDTQLDSILAGAFIHSIRTTSRSPFGIGLWSRWPNSAVNIVRSSTGQVPTAWLQTRIQNQIVNLWFAHPYPPLTPRLHAQRAEYLGDLAQRITATAGEHALAGDLNATPWSHAYRSLRSRANLRDASAHGLPWPTWKPDGILGTLLALPIDHALISPGLVVVDFRIGPDIGSDHRPLLSTLAPLAH